MFLDTLLDLITKITWGIVIFVFVVSFARDVRRKGIGGALRNFISLRVLVLLLTLLSVTILSASLVFIPPQERGVVISILASGGVRENPMEAGLNWIVPLAEEVLTYPIHWQTYTMADRPLEGQVVGDDAIVARTTDGQQVIINGSVIFRLNQGEVVRIHQEWQERYIDELIRPRTRGQIRDTVAKFTVDEVNSIQRTNLEAELDEELEKILSEHGFELDTFVLRNITFSDQYGRSVELKQVQEQGQVTSLYEAEQIRRLASGHADAVVVEANARAEAIKIEAQANADARLIQADAQAKAHVIEAEARAEALRLIEDALAQDPENLLTYQYINRLSPNIKALLLPSDTPLVLPLQNNLLTEEDGVPSTQNPLLPQSELLPEDLSQESLLDDQIVPQPPTVTQPPVVTSTVGITQTGTITN